MSRESYQPICLYLRYIVTLDPKLSSYTFSILFSDCDQNCEQDLESEHTSMFCYDDLPILTENVLIPPPQHKDEPYSTQMLRNPRCKLLGRFFFYFFPSSGLLKLAVDCQTPVGPLDPSSVVIVKLYLLLLDHLFELNGYFKRRSLKQTVSTSMTTLLPPLNMI